MAYVTLLDTAFNDPSVAGRTVRVEEIEIYEDGALFGFTWPENPYDMDYVGHANCRTATEDEVAHARVEYDRQDHIIKGEH